MAKKGSSKKVPKKKTPGKVAKKGGAKKAAPKGAAKKVAKAAKKSAAVAKMVSAAAAAPCVPASQAGPLVMGCAGQVFNVQTKLGVAFPSPNKREQFCQCVASKSGVPRAQIPCGAGNTFAEVIGTITC